VSVLVNREGSSFGQCSEICGILHSSMPIVIEYVSLEKIPFMITGTIIFRNSVYECTLSTRFFFIITKNTTKNGC
jgi:hypothetical protein